MSRSLCVKSEYLTKVKASLLRNGFPSQKILAENLGLAQSTISNFLNGKPVDYINFLEICQNLGHEWRDLADLDPEGDRSILHHKNEAQATMTKGKILLGDRSGDGSIIQHLQTIFNQHNYQTLIVNPQTTFTQYLTEYEYLLLIISAEYVISELILEEINQILQLPNPNIKPAILPICLDLPRNIKFSFDLIQLVENISPWRCQTSDDPQILAHELIKVIATGRSQLPVHHQFAFNWLSFTDQQLVDMAKPEAIAPPELPEGEVNLVSQFYIERPPIEKRCYETVTQSGSLIRIKAPRQMGKSSLLARILHYAEQAGSRTIALSFQLANKKVLTNSDRFLQWFCASIGQALGLLDALPSYWQLAELIGSNQCCKAYLEQCILPTINIPLTLGLDEVDRVFESPEIADDFFGLLRAIHEEAKRRPIWKNLRLIVVHSTEVYLPLDVNKSPFNVGLPIELPEFNQDQIEELAKRYGLLENPTIIAALTDLVGGHPYLLRLGMYKLARQDVTLEQLVTEAATECGIYSDHLRRHYWNLEKFPELLVAMKEVVTTDHPVKLKSDVAFKLNSMGLVKLAGNYCLPWCRLYQHYLSDRL